MPAVESSLMIQQQSPDKQQSMEVIEENIKEVKETI